MSVRSMTSQTDSGALLFQEYREIQFIILPILDIVHAESGLHGDVCSAEIVGHIVRGNEVDGSDILVLVIFLHLAPDLRKDTLQGSCSAAVADAGAGADSAKEIGLDGLAAGAATVGCCANMIGFAVASYRENGVSVNVKGLYPAGEGAGYAGGIMSAAVDGIRCAEVVCKNLEA